MERGRFHVALETTPPRTRRADVLLRRARLLGARPAAIHVIQRPDRLSSLDASLLLRQCGLHAVWHLVSRGHSEAELRHEIERALAGGVRSVLCIRGERGVEDKPDTPTLRRLVALLRERDPILRIGVTANQYLEPKTVLRNLLPKLEAGASFVQTQPVFQLAELAPLAQQVRARFPHVALLPMLMPLRGVAEVRRIAARIGASADPVLLAALEQDGEAAGWNAFETTLHTLAHGGLADGVALMTPSADPAPELVARLASALDACGGLTDTRAPRGL